MVDIGGADQREITLIGNGKDDPAVFQLQEIGLIMIEQAAHNDMRAPHQPQAMAVAAPHVTGQDITRPGPGRIDDGPGGYRFARPVST